MSIRNSAAVSSPARENSEAPAPQAQSIIPSDTQSRLRARVLVIGSGIAGLHTAMRAAEQCVNKGDVVLLTKRSLFDSSTNYAQGGIAAALGAGDSPALHRQDTLAAGGTLVDSDAVDVLVSEGPEPRSRPHRGRRPLRCEPTGRVPPRPRSRALRAPHRARARRSHRRRSRAHTRRARARRRAHHDRRARARAVADHRERRVRRRARERARAARST